MNSTRKKVLYIPSDKCYVFPCPHCNSYIQVVENEVNCQIFVHAVIKSTGVQVNPHASKEYCVSLVSQNLVDGCCKPFKLFQGNCDLIEYVDIYDYI